jgi:tape measure domain-containing protein
MAFGTTVGTAVIKVVADSSGFERAVNNLGHSAGRALSRATGELNTIGGRVGESIGSAIGSGVDRAFSFVARNLKRAIVGIGVGLAAVVGAAAVTGFKRFTNIEDATRALTIELGSAAKAARLLDEVLKVVQGTPFALDKFTQATQVLVSQNIKLEKIPGILTAIADAASASGRGAEGVDLIVDAFSRMATGATISLEPIRNLEELGIPALKILANELGTTTDELFKLIKKGAGPDSKKAIDLLVKGLEQGSKGAAGATVAFAGLAKDVTGLSSAFSNLKIAVARQGANIFKAFQQTAEGGHTISKIIASLTATIDLLGSAAVAVANKIVGSKGFGKMVAFFEKLPKRLTPRIESFIKFLKTHSLREAFFGPLSLFAPLITKVADKIAKGVDRISDAFGRLPGNLSAFLKNVKTEGFGDALVEAFDPETFLGKFVKGLVKGVRKAAKFFGPLAVELISAISDAFDRLPQEKFATFLTNFIVRGISAITSKIAIITAAVIKAAPAIIKGIIQGLIQAAKDAPLDTASLFLVLGLPGIGPAATGLLKGIFEKLPFGKITGPLIGGLGKGLQETFKLLGRGAKAKSLKKAVGKALSTILEGGGKLARLAADAAGVALGAVLNAAIAAGQKAGKAVKFVADAITAGLAKAALKAQPVIDGIGVAIGGAMDTAIAVGIALGVVAAGIALGLALHQLTEKFAPGIDRALEGFGAVLDEFFQVTLPHFFTKTIPHILDIIVKFFAGLPAKIGRTLESFGSTVVRFFTDLPGRIVRTLASLGDRLFRAALRALAGLARGFARGVVAVFSTLNRFKDNVIRNLIGFVGRLLRMGERLGKDLIRGLANGIRGFFNLVKNAISWLFRQAVRFFTAVFHIGSPSRVFFDFGRNLVEGLALGMTETTPLLEKNMKAIAERLVLPTGTLDLAPFVPKLPFGAKTGITNRTAGKTIIFEKGAITTGQTDEEVLARKIAFQLGRESER